METGLRRAVSMTGADLRGPVNGSQSQLTDRPGSAPWSAVVAGSSDRHRPHFHARTESHGNPRITLEACLAASRFERAYPGPRPARFPGDHIEPRRQVARVWGLAEGGGAGYHVRQKPLDPEASLLRSSASLSVPMTARWRRPATTTRSGSGRWGRAGPRATGWSSRT